MKSIIERPFGLRNLPSLPVFPDFFFHPRAVFTACLLEQIS
jgi:hypothetical protein